MTRTPFLATTKGLWLTSAALILLVASALTYARALSRSGASPVAADEAFSAPFGDPRPVDADDHVRGEGPVTLVEYADLECPYCRTFHAEVKRAMESAPGTFRWAYRHFPLTEAHPKALERAEAAECAGAQGRFWEFVDAAYADADGANGTEALARAAGVQDLAAFKACLEAGTYRERVLKDGAEAASVGGDGTPFSVIVGPGGALDAIWGSVESEQVNQIVDAVTP